ncbi:MAG: TolC family protein [Muribaculaceae bacterium]|nr:TolC family protein [Muribaculaceae bacterium]
MRTKLIIVLYIALSGCLCEAQQAYSLAELKNAARHNNHAIANAQRNVDVAGQRRAEVFTKYFPNISATGLTFNANKGMASIGVNPAEVVPSSLMPTVAASLPADVLAMLGNPINISMMKNGTIAGVTAIQPIYMGGQIRNGNQLAKVGEDVSHLQLELVENEVDKTTEQYYWQLISLQQKMLTVEAVEALLADIHKDVNVAVQAGVAMRNDLLQVQLRQNEVESQKLKLLNGQSVVKMLLSQHCGLNDTAFAIVVPQFSVEPVVQVSHSAALPGLAEYQLLNKQVEAATLNKKLTVGQSLPSVAVGAGYNYHNLLNNDRSFAMVFATVSVPISAWWGGSHAIKQRELERRNALESLTDNSELLVIRMQLSWNEVNEAHQQIAIANRSIEQAQENLRLNRDYYNAGLSKMSDLLEAQLLYQQALDSHTDAYTTYQMKLLEYRQSTGQ